MLFDTFAEMCRLSTIQWKPTICAQCVCVCVCVRNAFAASAFALDHFFLVSARSCRPTAARNPF